MSSAQLVKELREKTGAGFLECKKALDETGGNLDAAVEYLRKLGLKSASNKAARVAADGIVAVHLSGPRGVLVEVNCETDFVAKNEDFRKFADDLAELVYVNPPANLEGLLAAKLNGQTVSDFQNALIVKIGEKISVRRFAVANASAGEKIGSYIHLGNKIGVLVTLKGKVEESALKDVAMHVAASHPFYLKKSEIPAAVLSKEKEIFLEQLKSSGKPPAILEKIVEGKLAKFAQEVCLEEQVFIKDPSGKQSVAQSLKAIDSSLAVSSFIRYQVGEGIEKKKDDFAAEVARMAK